MATLEELVVQLTAETSSLKAELQTAQKVVQSSTDKMDKAIKEFGESSAKNMGFFETAVANAAGFLASNAVLGAVNVLKDSIKFLGGELLDAGQEAIREEQAFTLLASSLAQTGHYSREAADDLIKFTGDMEGLAGVSQDVIASNVALLSSLTRLDSEGLKKAETAAINMSAALGKDLGSTTEAVAKAINGNEGALGRLGIKLDLTADSTRNLDIVTKALEDRFGGAAAARLNTFGGALFVLKDAYGDMIKEVASSVTHNQVLITVMNEVAKIFQQAQQYIKENAVALRDGMGKAIVDLIGWIGDALDSLNTFFEVCRIGFAVLSTGATTIVRGFMAVGQALDGNMKDAQMNLDAITASAENTSKVWDSLGQDNLLTKGSKAFYDLRDSAQSAFDTMQGSAIQATADQTNLTGAINATTEAKKAEREALKSYVEGLAEQALAIDSQYKLNQQLLTEGLAQQLITQQEFFAEETRIRDEQRALELQKIAEAEASKLVTQEQANAARLQLNQQYALETMKQATAMKVYDEKIAKERLQGYGTFFGGLASLSESSSKELAAIGKASAISKATIDAYLAIQNALANVPFPANIAASIGIGVQAFANVSKIAGVGLKSGISEVPRSSMGGNNGDNFPAVLKSGERVITSDQNKDLKEFMDSDEGGGKKVVFNINILPNTGLNQEQIGDLVEQFNRYMQSGGLKLAFGGT